MGKTVKAQQQQQHSIRTTVQLTVQPGPTLLLLNTKESAFSLSVFQVSNISSSPSSFHSSPFFTIEFHHFRLFRFLKLKKINNRILQNTILRSKEDPPFLRQTQGNRS
ncbi:hypothetical protein SLA2020_013400 [Shorea laevis]